MKCHICGQGPTTTPSVALYRQNEKGVTGVWACWEHNRVAQDAETVALTQLIEQRPNPRRPTRRKER